MGEDACLQYQVSMTLDGKVNRKDMRIRSV